MPATFPRVCCLVISLRVGIAGALLLSPLPGGLEAGQEAGAEPAQTVQGEAADSSAPAPAPAPAAAAAPAVRDLGGGDYELNSIRFNSRSREIVLTGVVNLDDELLEYAIVNEKGAIHEALIRTTARPFDLQIVLLLLRYQPFKGGLFEGFDRDAENAPVQSEGGSGEVEVPVSARLEIVLRWQEDGEEREATLTSWIMDKVSGKVPEHGSWQFNGFPAPESVKYWKAEHESNMLGIYLNPYSPINWNHARNRSDDVWVPNREVMPPVETPVQIIFRPFQKP